LATGSRSSRERARAHDRRARGANTARRAFLALAGELLAALPAAAQVAPTTPAAAPATPAQRLRDLHDARQQSDAEWCAAHARAVAWLVARQQRDGSFLAGGGVRGAAQVAATALSLLRNDVAETAMVALALATPWFSVAR
jgi:hypothetical protein